MTQKYNLILCLMFLLLITVHAVSLKDNNNPHRRQNNITCIPLNIGEWNGVDQHLDESVYNILKTKSIIHRSYYNDKSQHVFLSIVNYEEEKVDFHAPESCLGGRGIRTEKSPLLFTINLNNNTKRTIKANKLIQKNNADRTLVYYFYKTGESIGRNYLWMRLNVAVNKLKGSSKNSSLIRISTTIINDEKNEALLLEEFITTLYPYLVQCL